MKTALTPRVMETLGLMAQGLNNAEIASRMHLRPKSVENYVNTIYEALNLTGETMSALRVKAVLWYLEQQEISAARKQ